MAQRKYFICNVTIPVALKADDVRQSVKVCAQNFFLFYASDHVLVNEARLLNEAIRALDGPSRNVCPYDLRALAQHKAIPNATARLTLTQAAEILMWVGKVGRPILQKDIENNEDDGLFYLENKQQANRVLKSLDVACLNWWPAWCASTAARCRTQRTRLEAWLVQRKALGVALAKKAAQLEALRRANEVAKARTLLEEEGYSVQAPKKGSGHGKSQ